MASYDDVAEHEGDKGHDVDVEQKTDLAHRLSALGEMIEGMGRELNLIAAEHGGIGLPESSDRAGGDSIACGTAIASLPGEISGNTGEFDRRTGRIAGAGDVSGLKETYLQVAKTLAEMAEIREPHNRGHSQRVSHLAKEIASWIGCSVQETDEIQIAGILHDVGKIVIPDYILFKPHKLTVSEYNEVKRHPAAAVELIRNLSHFNAVLPIIEGHHEWYNGMGYSNKLKDNDIHVGARILAVADAFDAMTSPRPHRSRLSSVKAIEIIKAGAGTQWDPMIVYVFMEVLGEDPTFLCAELEDIVAYDLALEEIKAADSFIEERIAVDEERGMMPGTQPTRKEISDKAAEALERARHWATWTETANKCGNDSVSHGDAQ